MAFVKVAFVAASVEKRPEAEVVDAVVDALAAVAKRPEVVPKEAAVELFEPEKILPEGAGAGA